MDSSSLDRATEIVSGIDWVKAPANDEGIIYLGATREGPVALRMNDFPSEHLFTLTLEGQPFVEFDEWPMSFGQRPWSSIQLLK